MKLIYLFMISLLFVQVEVLGSDHIDGVPSIGRHPQVDITDLYAFPSSDNKLSVILNVYPGVPFRGHFSSKVNYEVFIQNLSTPEVLDSPRFLAAETGLVVACSFEDPRHHQSTKDVSGTTTAGMFNFSVEQGAECSLQKHGEEISKVAFMAGTNEVFADSNGLFRVVVSKKADPFFFSRSHIENVMNRKGFPDPHTGFKTRQEVFALFYGNVMVGLNVLSLAFEIDMEKVFPDEAMGLLGVAAQSYTNEKGFKETLDSVGRPEITNLSLHAFRDAPHIKRVYNTRVPFALTPFVEKDQAFFEPYIERLVNNIGTYDTYKDGLNWRKDGLIDLAKLLLDDYLVLDLSKTCTSGTNEFFEIERALLQGVDHTSCGGRHPSDDVMATLYSVFIGGIHSDLAAYDTGINYPYQSGPRKVLSAEFPYLASPWAPPRLNMEALLRQGAKQQEGNGL